MTNEFFHTLQVFLFQKTVAIDFPENSIIFTNSSCKLGRRLEMDNDWIYQTFVVVCAEKVWVASDGAWRTLV